MPENKLKSTFIKTLKALLIIYACLLVLFFIISAITDKLPKPYHKRTISTEVTPWLK